MNVPTTWRYQYIKQQIINAYGEHKYNNFYQFGVFTCRSMVDMAKMTQEGNMNIDKFYGFDSFEGLPDDQENIYDIIRPYGCDWFKGQYSGAEWFGVNNADEALVASRNLLENFIPKDKLVLVKGYWENVLTDELFAEHKMGPALYIDIDGDIYHSAVAAMDFCCRNNILVPGTIVGYDDFGTPGFETFGSGESRCHKEMSIKYKLEWQPIFQLGRSSPHVQKVFKLLSRGSVCKYD